MLGWFDCWMAADGLSIESLHNMALPGSRSAVRGRSVRNASGSHWHFLGQETLQKYASDPRPPHTRQKYEQTSGQTMTQFASKQGKFGSLGAIFLFIFFPCMWGLGLQNKSRGSAESWSLF